MKVGRSAVSSAVAYTSSVENYFKSDIGQISLIPLPKTSLSVMTGEIGRFLKLSANAIVPISWTVPRRSTVDFPSDLFPPTKAAAAAMTATEWLSGMDRAVTRISLDPAMRATSRPAQEDGAEKQCSKAVDSAPATVDVATAGLNSMGLAARVSVSVKRTQRFRFLTSTVAGSRNNFEDVRSISITLSSDSDMLRVNPHFLAVPVSGPGGRVLILDANKPGRTPLDQPSVQCGSPLTDYAWDPFNASRLVTASDDACLRLWRVANDWTGEQTLPAQVLPMSPRVRANVVGFHPTASSVLATAHPDVSMTGTTPVVCLWDLAAMKERTCWPTKEGAVAFAFNGNGSVLAALCKDAIRLKDPRQADECGVRRLSWD